MSTADEYPDDGGYPADFEGGITEGCYPGGEPYDPGVTICNCLSDNIDRIADALTSIAFILDDKLEAPCKNIDDCAEKILAKIKSKVEGPVYASSECQRMAAAGQQGTIEYAVRCAGNVIDDCDRRCSQSEGETDGKCCNTCGQESCVCVDNECIPAPEQPPEDGQAGQYIGYCNFITGLVIVLERGEVPPDGYKAIGSADSQSQALSIALAACKQQTPQAPPEPEIQAGFGSSIICTIDSYRTGDIFRRLESAINASNAAAGIEQAYQGVGKIPLLGGAIESIGDIFTGLYSAATEAPLLVAKATAPFVRSLAGCSESRWESYYHVLANAAVISRSVGFDVGEFLLPYRYAMNQICPQRHLNADQSVATYLAGRMSKSELSTLWGMNGFCSDYLENYVETLRRKPEPLQLAIMRHRELITSGEYSTAMRELGFLESKTSEDIFEISRIVPTLSDIIRFMVRDADDETLVQQFGLDTEFNSKYGSQLKKWAKDQGISDTYAKYAWRSHWQIPSPTQLFEFYHRLRFNPKFGPPDRLLGDIKDALIQQDILPFWHDHYLAVSFRPMRLRDIRRSFEIGTLDDKGLENAFIQLGYSDDTVASMVEYTKRLRERSIGSSSPAKQWLRFAIDKQTAVAFLAGQGYPQGSIENALAEIEPNFITSEPAKAFVKGTLNRLQFLTILTNHGVSDVTARKLADTLGLRKTDHPSLDKLAIGRVTAAQSIQAMVDDGLNPAVAGNLATIVEEKVDDGLLAACVRAIKRRFVMGEINRGTAMNDLRGRGITNDRAAKLTDWWNCELKLGRREVSANKLCQWLAQGTITSVQFLNRLIAIGYDQNDAQLMMADCLTAANEKRLREAAKLAKDQAKAAEQLARRANQSQAKREREEQKIKRLRETAAKAKLSREKAFYSIIDKLTNKVSLPLPSVAHFIRNEQTRISREFGLTIDQALQVLTLAVSEHTAESLDGFQAIVDAIADATIDAELTGQPKTAFIPERNGAAS